MTHRRYGIGDTSLIEDKIELAAIDKLSLSPYQDGFVLIHADPSVRDKPILIHRELKTEMMWAMNKALRKKYQKSLHLNFVQEMEIKVEAAGFLQKKGWKETKTRKVVFQHGHEWGEMKEVRIRDGTEYRGLSGVGISTYKCGCTNFRQIGRTIFIRLRSVPKFSKIWDPAGAHR